MQSIKVSPEIFRAYDIRGIVNETLTSDVVYQVARAFAAEARDQGQKQIIIARDGRLSGPVLHEALKEGLLVSGCEVLDIGEVPTPLLYFATNTLSSQTGIMLTGSHNPANYNGLKMVIAGKTLAEETIQKLYQRLEENHFLEEKGSYTTIDIIDAYFNRITSDIALPRSLKVVVDAGNGIAGKIAPTLYRRLGCEVIPLFCEVDGRFPNHHPDPSVAENLVHLSAAVIEHQADIGLAFDGDGDRLGVVTNTGDIIWPDRQLMLYAQDVLSRHPGATIIYDVKCSRHLAAVIQASKGEPLMWKTGHSLIKQKMHQMNALLAGEMSGHLFFKERWYGFDDGLYSGARLLEILSKQEKTVSEVFKALPDSVNTPELKIAVTSQQRQLILEGMQNFSFSPAQCITIDGVRVEFLDGWALVRASNTTPHLTLRFEADSEEALTRIKATFRNALLSLDPSLMMSF